MGQREDIRRKKARALISKAGYGPIGGHFATEEDAKRDAEIAVHEHERHMHPGEKETKLTGLKSGGVAHGEAPNPRMDKRARGGANKGKHTVTNVIVAPQGGGGMAPGAMPPPMMAPRPPVAMGPPPGATPAPMPPPRPPMAGPPGGMPPGAMGAPGMMRKRGGVASRSNGGLTDPDWADGKDAIRMRARGGEADCRKEGGRIKHRDAGGSAPAPYSQSMLPGGAMGNGPMQRGPMGVSRNMMQPNDPGSTVAEQKRGGRAHRRDGGEVGPGRVEDMTGGSGGGRGRIEKSDALPYAEDKRARGRA